MEIKQLIDHSKELERENNILKNKIRELENLNQKYRQALIQLNEELQKEKAIVDALKLSETVNEQTNQISNQNLKKFK